MRLPPIGQPARHAQQASARSLLICLAHAAGELCRRRSARTCARASCEVATREQRGPPPAAEPPLASSSAFPESVDRFPTRACDFFVCCGRVLLQTREDCNVLLVGRQPSSSGSRRRLSPAAPAHFSCAGRQRTSAASALDARGRGGRSLAPGCRGGLRHCQSVPAVDSVGPDADTCLCSRTESARRGLSRGVLSSVGGPLLLAVDIGRRGRPRRSDRFDPGSIGTSLTAAVEQALVLVVTHLTDRRLRIARRLTRPLSATEHPLLAVTSLKLTTATSCSNCRYSSTSTSTFFTRAV